MTTPSGTSQPTASGKAASGTPADFTNLINLLLGPSSESQASAPDAPASSAPPAAAAAQLADSLIRSMLTSTGPGSEGNVASTSKKIAARSAAGVVQTAADATASAAAVVSPALNALTQSPLVHSADTSRGPAGTPLKGNLPGFSNAAVIGSPLSKAAGSAPLAFALRLTPSETESLSNAPDSGTETPALGDAGSEQSSQTPAAESPAPIAASQPQEEKAEPEPKPSTAASDNKARQEEGVQDASSAAPIAAVASATLAGGGMSENAGGFLGSQANPSSPQTGAKVTETPAPSAAQALRSAAPTAPASTQPGAPIREIAVRIASPQAPAVDVHLIERGGQINVAVRTPDGSLQTSLRQDLGSLVNSLERAGYRAEAFAPREGVQQAAISTQANSQNSRQESESGSGGRGNAFDDSQQGGQQQQRQRDPRAPKWIEELENQP